MDLGIVADPDLSWLSEPDAEPESKPKTAQASSLGAGHLILVARELTGLSQRKLAARAGTSQPALAKLTMGSPTSSCCANRARSKGLADAYPSRDSGRGGS